MKKKTNPRNSPYPKSPDNQISAVGRAWARQTIAKMLMHYCNRYKALGQGTNLQRFLFSPTYALRDYQPDLPRLRSS